jgi:HSP20 family protein
LLRSRQVADGTQPKTYRRTGKEHYAMINTLTRWEPMELADVENRLSRFFGRRTDGRDDITLADWAPLADITEDDKEYVIKAELPDVKKEDVKVTVENGVLTIAGERKFEKEEKKKKYHRVERAYGSFVRSFALPDLAEGDRVKAEFKDGMLTVHVPKSEKAKAKQVDVKIS